MKSVLVFGAQYELSYSLDDRQQHKTHGNTHKKNNRLPLPGAQQEHDLVTPGGQISFNVGC